MPPYGSLLYCSERALSKKNFIAKIYPGRKKTAALAAVFFEAWLALIRRGDVQRLPGQADLSQTARPLQVQELQYSRNQY